ncbi:unnamed protein product [Moneuplotes crassus]|uniref:Dynamin-type G domain-containing protein n=1 Tax=Euplotes crassus TaxID=5936 RepID=A0AAD1U1F2_EUPCR|nr:unnamed protein product [Moneuplotes crassus]
MQGIIPLINKIQEALMVVGSQSCGKSSVLESIVGKDFLPRGNGIVTRRPLVLQLYNIASTKEYAFFSHLDKEFTSFREIKEEIIRETCRVCGDNKGVSTDPIFLKIFSNNVINLTLVDLPGITKNPVGDQPKDIEKQINTLGKYHNSGCSPANADIANSDSLKMARKVDPKGERTSGIITKVDLTDEGTDALELLQGEIYPLKLGYIGMVCRSQKEINDGTTIVDSIKQEEKFFKTHPVYHKMSHNLGISALSSKLNTLFNALDSLHPLKIISDDDIHTSVENASALTPSLFVEEKAFHILVKQQIARLQEPALQCAEQVFTELRDLVSSICLPELER